MCVLGKGTEIVAHFCEYDTFGKPAPMIQQENGDVGLETDQWLGSGTRMERA